MGQTRITYLKWFRVCSIFFHENNVPIAVLLFFGAALRAAMNALINGSGNYRINFG